MTSKVFGIDLLKTIAVLAVIIIHTISKYPQNLTGLIIDQICRFSVPLFVAFSGFGLMLGYSSRKIDPIDYFRRRLLKLLPWYLFFTTIIILAVVFVFQEGALYNGIAFWRLYLLGKADIHLYFVPMIFQLYLLFPLLLFLFRKLPSFLILLLAFIWQVFWFFLITQKTELIGNNNRIWPDQQQYLFFTSWLFYFVLGMFFAQKINKLSAKWLLIGLLALVLGLAWSISSTTSLVTSGIDVFVATRFTRFPVLLYSSGVIIASVFLSSLIKKNWHFVSVSYLVYLAHTLVLRFVFRSPDIIAFLGPVATTLAIILLSFAVALTLDILARQIYGRLFQKNSD